MPPPEAIEFFRRIRKGTDWGAEFKFRWLSPDGRFLIWSIPGHSFWNGIGSRRGYAPTRHTLSDLSRMGPELPTEFGLALAAQCTIREEIGRLDRKLLNQLIAATGDL